MQKNRFWELEGLRGVAAIIVALYHFLLAFYAVALLGKDSGFPVVQHFGFEDNFYGSPFAVFLSGTFAVAIFFVLSGFVLSIGFFQTRKLDIIKKLAAKRYLRLMLPALASILIAFVLIVAGFSRTELAASITGSGWLATGWTATPNLFEAVKGGVFDIFVRPDNPYNNVLWTMMTEFAGSFLVFGFLALFAGSKYRGFLYGFLSIATFNSWFMAFVIGMILADVYSSGYLQQKIRRWYLVAPVAMVALFFGGYPQFGINGTIYQQLFPQILNINWPIVSLTIGASLLVCIVLSVQQVARVFAHKAVSRLGRYTFSLYLIHLSVLYTVTTGLFLLFNVTLGLGYTMSVAIAFVSSIPVLYAATILFEKYIDSRAIQFSSYIGGIVLGTTKAPRLQKYLRRIQKKLKPVQQPETENYVQK